MTWAAARGALATALAAVSITSPISQTVKRVYESPPGTVQDVPCFIIYPPEVRIDRSYGQRDKTYTVRCRLLVSDQDLDQAAALVDAFRESAIDKMDDNTELGGNAETAFLDRVTEAQAYSYGRMYTGLDCFVTIRLHDHKAFGA